jgi:hypothetical protein
VSFERLNLSSHHKLYDLGFLPLFHAFDAGSVGSQGFCKISIMVAIT